jgi:PAS domain S-box-containing protein
MLRMACQATDGAKTPLRRYKDAAQTLLCYLETTDRKTSIGHGISRGYVRLAHRKAHEMADQDITQCGRAEADIVRASEALAYERYLFHTLMDSTPDRIYFKDTQGRFVRVNRALAEAHGLSDPADVVGKTDTDFFAEEEAHQFGADEQVVMQTGEPLLDKENREVWLDGRETWCSASVMPFHDNEGNVIGVFGIARDITERKRVEREIEERRRYLEGVLRAALDAIVTLDATHAVVEWNPGAERLFGYLAEEAIGRNLDDLVTNPETREEAAGFTQAVTNREKVGPVETVRYRKDGSPVNVILAGSPLTAGDELIGTVSDYTDITERKRAEEALRVQHDLAVALSSASDLTEALDRVLEAARQVEGVDCAAIYLIDRFTGSVDMAAHTGLSPEFAERLSHLDASTAQSRLIMTGEPTYHQFSEIGLNTKEGVGGCNNLRAAGVIPVKHEGKIVATLNAASHAYDEFPARTCDVLEAIAAPIGSVIARVRAEAALRESRRNLQTLFDTLDDFLIIVDAEGRIVYFNPVVEERLGYSAAKLSGMNILELYPPERWKEAMTRLEEIVAGKTAAFTVSLPLMTRDGTQIPVETKGSLGKWGDRDVLFGISRDITERKRAEQSLRESEERYRTTIDAMDDLIQVVDEDLRVVLFNEAVRKAVAMFGTEGELTGKEITEILPAFLVDEARANYRRVLETGQPWHTEEKIQAGPHTILMEIRTIPILNEDGRAYRVITIMRDITERKRAEEQLQRYAADLEQASADVVRASEEIKQFAYIVSHDLRAPLVNLKGFATELRDGLEIMGPAVNAGLPHLDETQRQAASLALHEDVPEALEFIDASVERMDRFINAVLKLSRLGRRELRLKPVDVDALVQATLDSLAHQLEEHQVTVTMGPLPQVVADQTSMEQIVGNILGNAVKYLDPDRPGELKISAERNRDETLFHIRDNGRGIAEGDMDKVFAPFRRAGKQDVPGEGMGLPYVQTLVRRHGGRIWCESELGVGTTFTFTISNHLTEGGTDV